LQGQSAQAPLQRLINIAQRARQVNPSQNETVTFLPLRQNPKSGIAYPIMPPEKWFLPANKSKENIAKNKNYGFYS
jgi:hypothetical protein